MASSSPPRITNFDATLEDPERGSGGALSRKRRPCHAYDVERPTIRTCRNVGERNLSTGTLSVLQSGERSGSLAVGVPSYAHTRSSNYLIKRTRPRASQASTCTVSGPYYSGDVTSQTSTDTILLINVTHERKSDGLSGHQCCGCQVAQV